MPTTRYLFIACAILLLGFTVRTPVLAQEVRDETPLEGRVTRILEEKMIEIEFNNSRQRYQKLELEITSSRRRGERIVIESGTIPVANIPKYKTGDLLVITPTITGDGNEEYYISDYVRRTPLYILFAIFAGLTVLIGRKRGIASLVGMGISFVVIFSFVLPQILTGANPILTAVAASLLIIPVTFYLSHGFSRKTTAAVLGTIISLIITGILAQYFVGIANLTGFASEEASFLQTAKPGVINITGLLLAGIIIGVLGILDDITISQAAIVFQLKEASPKIPLYELFRRTMDIGRDHIASMVNTLILVYTGAALPLLLLFINTPRPFAEIINYEIIAEEIIRTLVASIGLILAVPSTTYISSLMANRKA